MKVERISEYLLRWGVTLFGIVLAIYLARQAASGSFGKIALAFTGTGLFVLVLLLRERIWLIVPLAWPLSGQIPELGIPLMARDLLVLTVFCAFLALKAFKLVPRK